MEQVIAVLAIVGPLVSAVLVALLNNWDKVNKNKKREIEMYNKVDYLQTAAQNRDKQIDMLNEKISTISSAQRASLQTHILEDCKVIQSTIEKGETNYSEELKQLIILYREYYLCGYNHQGQLYFNNTIEKAAEDNSIQVHELMNNYFPEYEPER